MRRRLTTPLVKATVFRAASIERLKDARCLHDSSRFHGAIYLCGYALECELKYQICVARGTGSMKLREARSFGHDLPELLDSAGKSGALVANRDLWIAFQAINTQWSTEIRYSGYQSSARESERFLKDSQAVMAWLRMH